MKINDQHRRALLGFLPMIAFAFLAAGPTAAQDAANALEDIEVAALPGNQVQLRLRMSDTAPKPETFSTDNPPRIAIDLPGTRLDLAERRTEIGIGPVRNVMSAESRGKVRLVVNLSNMVDYTIESRGKDVFVRLGSSGDFAVAGNATPAASRAEAPAATTVSGTGSAKPAPTRAPRAINKVDFRRGEAGEGRVVVQLSDPKTTVDMNQEGDRIILEFKDVELPESLVQRYDVADFATPVSTIDAMRRGANARLVVRAQGDYEQIAYQTGNSFTLEVKAIEKEAPAGERREREYTGERLTLNFQDLEVRAFFSIIAEMTGLNVVVSDSAQGNVTLRLQNVPWDQAVDIVLRTKGLAMRQNGNVMLVAPAAEIAEMERVELEAQQQVQQLEPLRSEFIQVNYAKAADLAALIKGAEGSALISDRGSVTVDARTNTLLVQDTSSRLADIRRIVQALDVPVRQVLIESRIVIANDDFNRELGVRLGYTNYDIRPNDPDTWGLVSGRSAQNLGLVENISQGDPLEFNDNRYNVNMPVQQPAGSIGLAVLGSSYLVDLELSALQAEGRGELVSSPRVVTADQKEALIHQGVEIPYQEGSASGATTTQWKEAVLELRVTPQITPDDRIIMDLQVKNDSMGENVPSATGGLVPSIDTREVATQVLVNNGDTVVLGGIYQTEQTDTTRKVPLLGDIPGLGVLFRSTAVTANKRELLIFVTPKILKEGLTAY
ncbi:MAG TPA: type IV pilus secretin PilQ [Gammaproteobacteria bacterium]|nr:type IV pilus secretin PilQ [Gammaproteobacteria bacterium]